MTGPLPRPSAGADRAGRAPAVVSARGLRVGFQDRTVWSDAELEIRRGEFVAVIGPNGAGKTTLFRLLLGLHPASGGQLTVFGASPSRGNARIGYVPQRHTITYETNIAAFELVRLGYAGNRWGFSLSGKAERAAAATALAAVGATELGDASLSRLSGGELQRIFLAEALVSDPEMLLLDEPLSNLDIRRARELVALVARIVRERQVTALLVAHDINPMIQYLDKVVYIANGRIAAGPPSEVLTSERLSALYGVPVEVLRDSRDRLVIVGGEDVKGDEAG